MKNRPAKILCLSALLVLASGRTLPAQTNTNAVAENPTNADATVSLPAAANANVVLPPKPRSPTQIYADRGEFDWELRQATYHGHVRVDDPEMKLTSEWLVANVPQAGERVNHIVAETNVVIDFADENGKTNHATCDRAVYSYEVKDGTTNESVTLSGHAKVENAEIVATGEPITMNLTTRKITADNMVVTPRQNLINPNARTSSPPATKPATDMTNLPPATHRTGADTNFPPGKLDLIPEPRVAPRNF